MKNVLITGAGGFLGSLAASGDAGSEEAIRKATIYGTVLASFAVESFSLERLSAATRDEIESRYRGLQELARF